MSQATGNEYGTMVSLMKRIAELEAENAALKIDAECLDFLDTLLDNRWLIESPFKDIRTAIKAMKEQSN